ncbi:MAG: quinolinate synthase NadA [Bacteroidales bacterium]|jgi:quinolinate synthase|nr:quinolinate synthase NadA [Bacteroidales bacterium]
MKEKLTQLKAEKNAVILAHYYTVPEVQEVADFVGDSLALSQLAAKTDKEIILFAGVHFMAETAKILNPSRKVIIPDLAAGCSLADSCPPETFAEFLQQYPDHLVLSYINCSAAIKTMSDIIVTSGNAIKIVSQLPENEKIVFAPDANLGAYINATLHRQMVLWRGACHVHDQLTSEAVFDLKHTYPSAKVIAHPECQATVLALADFVGSTAAMLNYVGRDEATEYIVATETGIIYEMQNQNPNKLFHVVAADKTCACNDCKYMKLNTLDKIYQALLTETPELTLDEHTIQLAKKPLVRMLKMCE